MGINLRSLLSPEAKARIDERDKRVKERKEELLELDNEAFANRLEYCMVNSEKCDIFNKPRDFITYDDAMVWVFLPEVLRRLRGGREERPNTYSELKKRCWPELP